jgi:hypothetical protein
MGESELENGTYYAFSQDEMGCIQGVIMKFFDRLNASIALNHSILCVSLEPDPDLWPQQLGDWDVARSNLWGVQDWLRM